MREIVLDTETTGLDPADGHRVLEIGAVEIVHQSLTGKVFHTLINPERDVPQDAVRVHGHNSEVLKDKPVFASIVDDFLAFIGDAKLVIHNAEFDVRFMNAELARLGLATIAMDRVVDTLALARKKHPGAPASLDAFATATALTARGGFATARCWTQRSWSRSIASYREVVSGRFCSATRWEKPTCALSRLLPARARGP